MQRGRWWSWAAVAATLPLTVAAFFLPSPFEETVLAAWGFLVWRAARASRRAHRIRELELPRLED